MPGPLLFKIQRPPRPPGSGSKSVHWFWNLTETSHRIPFLITLSGCLVLFILNLYFIIHTAPGFFHETSAFTSTTQSATAIGSNSFNSVTVITGQGQHGLHHHYHSPNNRFTQSHHHQQLQLKPQQQPLSLKSRNLLNVLLLCACILHFIVLTIGLIGLVRNQYQWILGFITSWTILFVVVDLIIYSVTGRFYLEISGVLVFLLFIVATIVHVILITYPQSDDVTTGYAYAV